MIVTLNELLTLVGRLDDGPGFDTARERFRRFLVDHVTDARDVRALIEQCQYSPGDQHHRALQDLVVLLGGCLGFDVRFGSYLPAPGAARIDGHWHSRPLDVVLEIRTDLTQGASFDSLSRAVATVAANSQAVSAARALGLCVMTPLYANRARFEDRQTLDSQTSRVRLITLSSLLSVADMIAARRLTHDDLVRVMGSGLDLDFAAHLLERAASADGVTDSAPSGPAQLDTQPDTSFWLAVVGTDHGATPEQFLEIVVARRHLFGIGEAATSPDGPDRGDGISFFISGKGIVGHCHLGSPAGDGAGIRDGHRFRQVYHLRDVVLHLNAPVSPDEEIQLRVRAARPGRSGGTHPMIRITRQEFERLATVRRAEERRPGDSLQTASGDGLGDSVEPTDWRRAADEGRKKNLPVSVGDSRSHE